MTSAPDEACWSDGSYETIVQQGSPLVFKTACHRRADSSGLWQPNADLVSIEEAASQETPGIKPSACFRLSQN